MVQPGEGVAWRGQNVEGPGAFAALLREHRAAANITQEELAERSGLSPHAIAALERGARRSPRPSTVEWLAEALKLDPQQRDAFIAAARGLSPADMGVRADSDPDSSTRSRPPIARRLARSALHRMRFLAVPRVVGRQRRVAAITVGVLTVALIAGYVATRHQLGGNRDGADDSAVFPVVKPPTVSPQTASSEHPIPCRLPLDLRGHGAFVDLTDQPVQLGVYGGPRPSPPDPAGRPRLPDGEEPVRVMYDWSVGTWLPVEPAWVAPDGRRYAYTDRQGALRIVDAATGRERRINGSRVWSILSFQSEGIYAGELTAAEQIAGGSVSSGLWLVDGSSGQARQLRPGGPWQFVGGGAAWALELRPPTATAPPWAAWSRYGNTLVRLDLVTGRTATVYAVSNTQLRFIGLDAQGEPLIADVNLTSPLTIVEGRGHLRRDDASGGWINAIPDGGRTWFTETSGVWVKDAAGIREVDSLPSVDYGPFRVAGRCG